MPRGLPTPRSPLPRTWPDFPRAQPLWPRGYVGLCHCTVLHVGRFTAGMLTCSPFKWNFDRQQKKPCQNPKSESSRAWHCPCTLVCPRLGGGGYLSHYASGAIKRGYVKHSPTILPHPAPPTLLHTLYQASSKTLLHILGFPYHAAGNNVFTVVRLGK